VSGSCAPTATEAGVHLEGGNPKILLLSMARNAEAGIPPADQRSCMSEIQPKCPPVRLDAKACRKLCKEALLE